MHTVQDLQAVKDRFGRLVFLDFTHVDLQTAHRLLGEHVRLQVQKILRQRLEQMDRSKLSLMLSQACSCAETLTEKLTDLKLDPRLQGALQEYVDCLVAWADGAGLRDFDHPVLASMQSVCPLDLALLLQHDNAGCQTGMYRREDGSVILWHTEEDVEFAPGSGFDQLRLAAFNIGDDENPITMTAFIYPDLLPGPAFSWRSDGYAQAVDTLHTREAPFTKNGMLANILTWLTLRLGPDVERRSIIERMGPYFDGYALNAVSLKGGSVTAEKFEFTEDKILPSVLGNQPGEYLFQVNIFSQDEPSWVKEVEHLPAEDHQLYLERMKRTDSAVQNKDHRMDAAGDMSFFFDLLTTHSGSVWSYANVHVMAYFILHQTPQGAEIWLGHGPALPGDQYTIIHVPASLRLA